MTLPLVFAFLVLLPADVLGKYVNYSDDITYNDLVQTNVTCAYTETCQKELADPFQDRRCQCDSDCPLYGACCIDTPDKEDITQMVECRNIASSFYKGGIFLVSRCPNDGEGESIWKDLCEKEWNGEDDMMKLAPVSSLDTFVSYKNYYCFRCHEDTDNFLNWQFRIQSNAVDESKISEDFRITYDKKLQRWIATTGDEYVLDNIQWNFFVPAEVQPETCNFALLSDCAPSWTDEDTRRKCRAYSAVVYSKNNDSVSFKNPHCALCNFEPPENLECGFEGFSASVGPKKVFSFAHLLNINREDSEADKCEGNQIWDPYARKCRRIACAVPGYVVKEGRCTPP